MNRIAKIVSVLLSCILLFFTFCACSAGNTDAESTTENATETTTEAETNEEETKSAYDRWIQELSEPNSGDAFDDIIYQFDNMDRLYNKQALGDEDLQAFLDMFTFKDFDTTSIKGVNKAYEHLNKKIADTGITIRDLFQDGSGSADNFATVILALGYGSQDANGYILFENLKPEKLAKDLDVDKSLIEVLIGNLKRYGADITLIDDDTTPENIKDTNE